MGSLLERGAREQIRVAMRTAGLETHDRQEQWRKAAEHYLRAEVAAWNTRLGPVSFGIEPDDEADTGWKTVLEFGGSMPCYIGLQLMLVIAGGDIFTCSSCGKPYVRPRGRNAPNGLRKAPKARQRNYCQNEDCIREGNRLAAERRRARLKENKR